MTVLALLVLLSIVGYLGYVIGVELGQERPCEQCRIRRETTAAEMQLQQITHAAMAKMLDEARQTQRDQLP